MILVGDSQSRLYILRFAGRAKARPESCPVNVLGEGRDDLLPVLGHDALFLAAHQVNVELRHAGRFQRCFSLAMWSSTPPRMPKASTMSSLMKSRWSASLSACSL